MEKNNDQITFLNDKYNDLLSEVNAILMMQEVQEKSLDISDTPISPMSLNDCFENVFLSKEVISEYESVVSRINKSETALEYAYLLVGRKDESGNIIIDFIFDVGKQDSTNNRSVEYDNSRLSNIIDVMSKNGCNFMCICHTHPLISYEERKKTISNYLSEELLEKECIREVGLNLSLQDLMSFKGFFDQMKKWKPDVECASTVVMYNGEIAMFRIKDGELCRYINIYDLENKIQLQVPSSEKYIESHKRK